MVRTRRRTRTRSASQRAASLIALALPAPVQRIADTQIGSLLMLVGVPVLIVFGLLNITWVDGFPTFSFNRAKASELRNVASQQLNQLEHQAATQNWGQTAVELLHAAQGPNHQHNAPFPSTQPRQDSPYNAQPNPLQYQTQVAAQQFQPQPYPSYNAYPTTNYQQPNYYSQQPATQWPQPNSQPNYNYPSGLSPYGSAAIYSQPTAYPNQNSSYNFPSTNSYGQSNLYPPQTTPGGSFGRY
jgi:hypothetical protein